jgi:hypothetical protein
MAGIWAQGQISINLYHHNNQQLMMMMMFIIIIIIIIKKLRAKAITTEQ